MALKTYFAEAVRKVITQSQHLPPADTSEAVHKTTSEVTKKNKPQIIVQEQSFVEVSLTYLKYNPKKNL